MARLTVAPRICRADRRVFRWALPLDGAITSTRNHKSLRRRPLTRRWWTSDVVHTNGSATCDCGTNEYEFNPVASAEHGLGGTDIMLRHATAIRPRSLRRERQVGIAVSNGLTADRCQTDPRPGLSFRPQSRFRAYLPTDRSRRRKNACERQRFRSRHRCS